MTKEDGKPRTQANSTDNKQRAAPHLTPTHTHTHTHTTPSDVWDKKKVKPYRATTGKWHVAEGKEQRANEKGRLQTNGTSQLNRQQAEDSNTSDTNKHTHNPIRCLGKKESKTPQGNNRQMACGRGQRTNDTDR